MNEIRKQKGGFIRPFILYLLFLLIFVVYPGYNIGAYNLYQQPGKLYPAFCICFPTNKIGWIAGHFGKIWHTKDGGKTWILQDSHTTSNIADIYFVDAKNGWAVGYSGLIIHTKDGGKTWIRQKSPFKYFWKSVYFKNKRDGWIVGEMGTVLSTNNGGITWKVLITGDDLIFNSITFSPDGHAWAAGEFGVIYSSNDSKRWFLQDNGIASKDNTVWSISYIGNNQVIAVGIASLLLFKDSYKDKWHFINSLKLINGDRSIFRILKFKNKLIVIGQKNIYYSEDPYGPWKKAKLQGHLMYGEWLYDVWNNGKSVWVLGVKGSIYYSNNGIEWKKVK